MAHCHLRPGLILSALPEDREAAFQEGEVGRHALGRQLGRGATGGTYSASKAAAWSLTNGLGTALKKQGAHVPGVHAGPVDTDLASQLRLPKVQPAEVVRQTLSALEEGRPQVLVDDSTRQVKAGLLPQLGIHPDFDPRRGAQEAA